MKWKNETQWVGKDVLELMDKAWAYYFKKGVSLASFDAVLRLALTDWLNLLTEVKELEAENRRLSERLAVSEKDENLDEEASHV